MIFAEGASETIMRVALSLMRKNEEKILACSEFEDVMQLLLSRGLWDCYHYNADDFVNDFVSLTGVVTHESLQALELSYKESQTVGAAASETVGSTASSFLGRLWAGSNSNTKSVNLSPGLTAPSRPVSFLRRSTSKQSIASTMNSMEGGGSDSIMSASTDATSISRDSSNTDGSSIRGQSVNFHAPTKSNKDKNLHGQIEDLLTALSEMQRDHAILATQLQREREEREEDRIIVKSLLDVVKTTDSLSSVASELPSGSTTEVVNGDVGEQDQDTPLAQPAGVTDSGLLGGAVSPLELADLSSIIEKVEARFEGVTNRRSSMLQSKSQLREELARSKEQLINEVSKTQEFSRRLTDQEQEITNLKDQLREGRNHIRSAHQEKQRLEKQIHDLRVKKTPSASPDVREWPEPDRRGSSQSSGGLKELRLGRSNSKAGQPAYSKRTSSLNTAAIAINTQVQREHEYFNRPASFSNTPTDVPDSYKDTDMDALVLELVQAKTAEAQAKQEAEEAKAKLDSMRKLLGMKGDSSIMGHKSSPSQPNLLKRTNVLGSAAGGAVQTPASAPGGFWGGWGKKNTPTE